MSAPEGNQFWKLRSKHGRDKLFESAELMWEAACEYFEWAENHPLKETKAFSYLGTITKTKLPKMRAMTLSQLCFYLHCSDSYFRAFKLGIENTSDPKLQDFLTVIHEIESVIFNQKFQGAAADLLNANIIARDLKLSENIDHTNNGNSFNSLSDDEIVNRVNKLLKSKSEG
jgi:hypothetical protein